MKHVLITVRRRTVQQGPDGKVLGTHETQNTRIFEECALVEEIADWLLSIGTNSCDMVVETEGRDTQSKGPHLIGKDDES